jgi:hypothetical protein
MKFRPVYIAIIFALVVIIFITSSTGSTYVPYMKTSYFDQAFPYEGMATLAPADTHVASVSPIVSDKTTPVPPTVSGNVAPTSGLGSYMSWMSNLLPSKQSESSAPSPTKVEGFALQPGAYAASEMIDRYGKTPSEASCFGKSMGYSRSTGPLCFNDEDLKLLTTRGGNMGSRDSVIGQDLLK